jgi:hypothetical protein
MGGVEKLERGSLFFLLCKAFAFSFKDAFSGSTNPK